MSDRGILSSLRYLFADFIGDDDDTPPFLPEGLPEAGDGGGERCHPSPDRLSGHRATRSFMSTGCGGSSAKQGVDDAMLIEIARLMAVRMSYEDPIRIAQLKLAELDEPARRATAGSVDVRKFRVDELVGALPAVIAEYLLDALEWAGWSNKRVSIRFSTASRLGIRRLKIEAGLRRWRLFSVRYAKERVWVERWLHMIDRSLTKQPAGGARDRADRDHDRGLWRRLSSGHGGLECDHRRPGQADLRRRAGAVGSRERGDRGARRRAARSAAGRAQAQDRRNPGAGRLASAYAGADFTRSARSSRPPPCRPGPAGAASDVRGASRSRRARIHSRA